MAPFSGLKIRHDEVEVKEAIDKGSEAMGESDKLANLGSQTERREPTNAEASLIATFVGRLSTMKGKNGENK